MMRNEPFGTSSQTGAVLHQTVTFSVPVLEPLQWEVGQLTENCFTLAAAKHQSSTKSHQLTSYTVKRRLLRQTIYVAFTQTFETGILRQTVRPTEELNVKREENAGERHPLKIYLTHYSL